MGGLGFLAPIFLAAGLAAAVPLVLHLLSRETGPLVPFPMVRFLRPTTVEQARRRRPTDWLLLALRMLALLLLAFAFARPFFEDADAVARTRGAVVAIDTSASMKVSATWAEARRRAVAAIDATAADASVAVIAFDDAVRVVHPLSADRASARAAVEALAPSAGHGTIDAGVRGALDVLASREGTITIVSDLQRASVPTALEVPDGVALAIAPVAPAVANLAVAALDGDVAGIRATVTNAGRAARATAVTFTHDGRDLGRAPVVVPPRGTATATWPLPLPRGGVIGARLDDPEGLPDDNARVRVLDPAPAVPVVIVTAPDRADDAIFVAAALGAVDPATPFTTTVTTTDRFDPASIDGPRGARTVLVLLATRGLGAAAHSSLARWMQSGAGRTFVAVGPDAEAGVMSELFGTATTLRVREADAVPLPTGLAVGDVRHPVVAALGDERAGLDATRVTRLVRLAGLEGGVVLRFTNGLPAVVDTALGQGRLMVMASDLSLQWNDLPRQPVMVALVASLVRELAGREAVVAGRGDEAADRERPRLVTSGTSRRRVAVNIDPAESTLDVAAPAEVEATVVRSGRQLGIAPAVIARDTERSQSWWRVAIFAMAMVLVIESIVGAARRAVPAPGGA